MSQQSGSESGELVEIDTSCFQTILDTLRTDKGLNTDLLQTIQKLLSKNKHNKKYFRDIGGY